MRNFLLVLCSSIVAILACEGILRLALGDILSAGPDVVNKRHLTYAPNMHLRFKYLEWDIELDTNELGFRETLDLNRAEKVALFLGDSFTEGWGVEARQAYPAKVGKRLSQKTPQVETYNAGIAELGPISYFKNYVAFFESAPSVCFVGVGLFLGNDIVENQSLSLTLLENLKKDEIENSAIQSPQPDSITSIKRFLAMNSAIYMAINRIVKSNFRVAEFLSHIGLLDIGNNFVTATKGLYQGPELDENIDFTANIIRILHDRVTAQDIPFTVYIFPSREQIDAQAWETFKELLHAEEEYRHYANERMAKALRNRNIAVYDLTKTFLDASREGAEKLYFEMDPHWNAKGHEVAAEFITNTVRCK
ncbi:MAG: hypothetical protein QF553_05295 [Alphaproteobacteria bacterium]|nr:hypothetical protein [Alphaproteobacteria bacterium]